MAAGGHPFDRAASPRPDGSFGTIISGVVAVLVTCALLLARGLLTDWTPIRAAAYGLLMLFYLALTLLPVAGPWAAPLCRPLWRYVVLCGAAGLALQSISGDPYIQPIVFTVPFVHAAIESTNAPRRIAAIGALYLGLAALGIWLSGERAPEALAFPVAAYGALMGFMYAFTVMSVVQAAARRRADQLAADLARERDYLARLVQVTATLTRDLDLVTVLELVAAEGRTLARAGQAWVWLHDPADAGEEPRLAAAVPARPAPALGPDERRALLEAGASHAGAALILPLRFKDQHIGALELRDRAGGPFTPDDATLLQPFVDAAAVAIQNARLYEQERATATLVERNRLARELHDTIAQGLTATTMQLEAAQRSFERDPARARARLTRAHELARETLDDVRRSVWMLASPLLEGGSLSAALADLAARFAQRTGVSADYRLIGPAPSLDPAAASQVLRIVQEALQNVEKHAHATSVQVEARCEGGELQIEVRDNGVGFEGVPQPGRSGGFGLISLRERARLANATIHVESAPGAGTSVTVVLPAES